MKIFSKISAVEAAPIVSAWGFPRELTINELVLGHWFHDPGKLIYWAEPGDNPSTWWPHLVVNPDHRGKLDLKGYWWFLRAYVATHSPPGSVLFLASDPGGKAEFFKSMGFVEYPGKNLYFMFEEH